MTPPFADHAGGGIRIDPDEMTEPTAKMPIVDAVMVMTPIHGVALRARRDVLRAPDAELRREAPLARARRSAAADEDAVVSQFSAAPKN